MQRKKNQSIHINHPVMPVELIIMGNKIELKTEKNESQVQLLLNDIAAILTVALNSGVQIDTIIDSFHKTAKSNTPITRLVAKTIATIDYGEKNES